MDDFPKFLHPQIVMCQYGQSENGGCACSDLDTTTAEDYEAQPVNFLPLVNNATILQWGYAVNALWNYLSRVVRTSGPVPPSFIPAEAPKQTCLCAGKLQRG